VWQNTKCQFYSKCAYRNPSHSYTYELLLRRDIIALFVTYKVTVGDTCNINKADNNTDNQLDATTTVY